MEKRCSRCGKDVEGFEFYSYITGELLCFECFIKEVDDACLGLQHQN